MEKTIDFEGVKISWLNHASFRIEANSIVYIDPFKIDAESKKADFILITHDHFDHFSIEDIRKIATQKTIFVMPTICAQKFELNNEVVVVKPNQRIDLGKLIVETIPAYNLNKNFHPKANGYVGYVLTIAGVRIYHAGDTDHVIEMNGLKNIDVALVPIGGTYTMGAVEAAKAVNSFKPRIVIPMHWGSIVGKQSDAVEFKKNVKGVEVVIL